MRFSRTTLFLLLANLLAFGLVWKATYRHDTPLATQDLIFVAPPSKVVITENASRLVLEKHNTSWQVTEPFNWGASIWAVQRLLDELRFISRERGFSVEEVKATGSGLEAYGLANPRWVLKITYENGTNSEVKIGQQAATRLVFLLTEDGQKILPLSEAMTAALEAKPETYRLDKVFEVAEFETRAVSIRQQETNNDVTTTLTWEARSRVGKKSQTPEWRFETPYDAIADADMTIKAVADLSNLRATRFVSANEEVSGLNHPKLSIALEGNSRRQVLLIGKPSLETPSLVYAKLEDNNAVFLLEAKALNDWQHPRESLASSRPADFDPTLVTGFTLSSGGRSITLHRLDATVGTAGRWEIPVAPGSTAVKRREADTAIVQRFLEAVSQLRAVRRKGNTSDGAIVPAVIAVKNSELEAQQKLELEFGTDRLVFYFTAAPDQTPTARLIYQQGAPLAAICDVTSLRSEYQSVEPQTWRKRVIAALPQGGPQGGARVSGLRLTLRGNNQVLGEARLGPDGNWVGNGKLEPAMARRLAIAFAEVKASEFPLHDYNSSGWKYELRITDQAAAGATGASETVRTYLCASPLNAHTVLLRDENDGDDFLLETKLAEILTPLLDETSR
jgi:hypothetical protein